MRKLNKQNIIAYSILIIVVILFYILKIQVLWLLKSIFENEIFTWLIVFYSILIFINYIKFGNNNEYNSVVELVLFAGTHISILYTIISLCRECFYQFFFIEFACKNFNKFDLLSFIVIITSLSTYFFSKNKPVFENFFFDEKEIKPNINTQD